MDKMDNMQIPLRKDGSIPMYRQMVEFIQQQISVGNLPAGSVLPSIRSLAEAHNVSKTIVSMAYAELQAQGLVEGRVGQGTVVVAKDKAPPHPAYLLPELATSAGLTYDFLNRAARENTINLSTNAPSPHHFPLQTFGRSVRTVLNEDMAAAFRYDPAEGLWPLRKAVARHLMDRGIVATPSQIVITAGAQQAIHLVLSELVAPGECIVVENPCYMGLLANCAGNHIRVVPVSVTDDGIDMDTVEDVFRRMRPRLIYTIPSFHNPTGVTMRLPKRQRLIQLAEAYDVTIVEDGVSSELQLFGQPEPALRALDEGVVHCGSFSKSLLPGLRIGYVVAPEDMVRKLALRKQAQDVGSPGLLQRALAHFLGQGHFAPHLRNVLGVYRERRQAAVQAMQDYMPDKVHWSEPDGGFWLWVRLARRVDTTALYVDANNEGVTFAPGVVFFAANAPGNYLRLSYGAETPERIREGIAIIARLADKQMHGETSHKCIL